MKRYCEGVESLRFTGKGAKTHKFLIKKRNLSPRNLFSGRKEADD